MDVSRPNSCILSEAFKTRAAVCFMKDIASRASYASLDFMVDE